MRYLFTIFLLCFSVQAKKPIPPPPPSATCPSQVTLDPALWIGIGSTVTFYPIPSQPGWRIDFPQVSDMSCEPVSGCPAIHTVVTYRQCKIVGSAFVMDVEITSPGTPIFHCDLTPEQEGCEHYPAISFYFARAYDYQSPYYRWWSDPIVIPAGLGRFTVSFPMQPSQWISLWGERGDNSTAATAGFIDSLANSYTVGFAFGGCCFKGHGLCTTDAPASFFCHNISIAP